MRRSPSASSGPLLGGMRGWRVHPADFVERHGLIVIIAIGESLIAIGVGARGAGLGAGVIVAAVLGLVAAAAFWLAYFDFFPIRALQLLIDRSGVPAHRSRARRLHLPPPADGHRHRSFRVRDEDDTRTRRRQRSRRSTSRLARPGADVQPRRRGRVSDRRRARRPPAAGLPDLARRPTTASRSRRGARTTRPGSSTARTLYSRWEGAPSRGIGA